MDWIVRIYRGNQLIDQFSIDGNRNEYEATREAEADIDRLNDESIDWTLTLEKKD